MSFVKQGTTALTKTPTIASVTVHDSLLSIYVSEDTGNIAAAPTDSAGQTWTLIGQTTGSGMRIALAGLIDANAGTHTLTWPTPALDCSSSISEWTQFNSLSGGTKAVKTATSANTHTSNSYTPATSGEIVIAVDAQLGTGSSDGMRVTTTAFQSIGTASDAGTFKAIHLNQNGGTSNGAEANANAPGNTTPLTVTWTWTTAEVSLSFVIGVTDTASGGTVNTKTINETISAIIDVLTASKIGGAQVKTITDLISINDPMVKINQVQMNFETLTVVDSQSAFMMRTRSIIDALVAADILTDSAIRNRSLAEAIAVIDLLTAVKSGGGSVVNTKSITESMVLADQIAQFKLLFRSAIDPFQAADIESKYILASRQQTDSMLITDAEQAFAVRNKLVTDNVAVNDFEQAFRILNRQLQDPFAVIDILVAAHTGSQIHTLSITDTLVAIDQLLTMRNLTRSQLDQFPVIEAILAQFVPYINPNTLARAQIKLGMYDGVYLSAMDPVRISANDSVYLSSVA
jgi:hypothetical protein